MNVALYTIFRCTNYGAVLQAYALSRTLRGIVGEDAVDVINHRMDPRDNHILGKITNPNTPWLQRWRNKRKFAARYLRPDLFETRRAKTIRLIEEYIRPTQRLYKRPEELREMPTYATVVVGSDQIWNPGLNHDFGRNQYLAEDFPEGQDRVAYAASFGVSELPPDCIEEYRRALSRFRSITVREESGARLCKELLGGETAPPVVLDPTMLLSADDWRAVIKSGDEGSRGRYVAAYWVRTLTAEDIAALARVSRSVGAPVRLMSAGPMPKFDLPPEVTPFIDAAPFEFVGAIADSCAVVTDSFHGLQFSALFSKPFIVLGNLSNPKSNASRLVDFCARYRLTGGLADIVDFRAAATTSFADLSGFTADILSNDRVRSFGKLKGMLS